MGYWPDFNLQSVFILINIFNMKNVTDFRKTVETGVDPHLFRSTYSSMVPTLTTSRIGGLGREAFNHHPFC